MPRHSFASWLFAALFVATVAGCPAPAGTNDGGDATTGNDSAARRDARTCPPPNRPCLMGCGNEVGVGMPCTRGGGECMVNGFSNAFLCTADFVNDPNELAFCTRACSLDSQCGTGARCAGDPNNMSAGRGCFPTSCDSPAPDGGASDGGSDAATEASAPADAALDASVTLDGNVAD